MGCSYLILEIGFRELLGAHRLLLPANQSKQQKQTVQKHPPLKTQVIKLPLN